MRVCDYRLLLVFNFTVKLDGVEGRSGLDNLFAFLSNEIEHQQEAIITHPQKMFSKPKSVDLWNDEGYDNFIFFK